MSAAVIRQRVQQHMGNRRPLEFIWKLVEQFISPYRTMFYTEKSSEGSVDWRLRDLFDSSAILDNQNLAANLDGSLTSSAIQWFGYTFKQPEAKKYVEVQKWLEESNRIAYTQLQTSNFSLETNELYLDITSFGIGALSHNIVETPTGGLDNMYFKSIPLDEWYFDEDYMGKVENFYRVFYWTAAQIVSKFGEEGTPMNIYDQAISGVRADERHKIIYCIYKRKGPEYDNVNTFNILEPDARPYGEKYFMFNSLEELGEEGGFYEMPVYIPRWRKSTGSIWGWGPSMTAIYDVLTLNQATEMTFQAGEKVIDPALLVQRRGVYGDIDLSAAGVTIVSNKEAVTAFESSARFDISNIQRAELKEAIRRAFFADQLQLKDTPAMTATEVLARIQLMQRLLGPTFGRLQSDYLDNLLNRTFKSLYRYRLLPPVPEVVVNNGWELEIDYLGPLAKSQRVNDAQAIDRVLGTAQSLKETWPDIVDNIDSDAALRELGEVVGTPAKVWRTRDAVSLIRDNRQREAQKVQDIRLAQEEGSAMKAMGEGGQALKVLQGGIAA